MTLQVRSTVAEAENAVRVFTQLSAAADLHVHGFDGKKIQTHVQYCSHLLEAAKVHREAAEQEELQNRQRLEVARQAALADEARRKAEEQRKYQVTIDLQVNICSNKIILVMMILYGFQVSDMPLWVFSLGQLEKRKQEDELRRLKQEEEKIQRIKVGGLLLLITVYTDQISQRCVVSRKKKILFDTFEFGIIFRLRAFCQYGVLRCLG